MPDLTRSPAWQALHNHFEQVRHLHMRDLFTQDPKRFQRYSIKLEDFLLDYSKNRITDETESLLLELARDRDVPGWITRMFNGEKINHTEDRAVLHIALRNRANRPILVDGRDVMPEVNAMLEKMRSFCDAIHSQKWRGAKVLVHVMGTGQHFFKVVHTDGHCQ